MLLTIKYYIKRQHVLGVQLLRWGSFTATVLLLFGEYSIAVSQQLPAPGSSRTQPDCDPIGRVLSSSDRHYPVDSLLCRGARLDIKKGATVKVFCYSNGNKLNFSGSLDVTARCPPRQTTTSNPCPLGSRKECRKTKGPGNENVPEIITPHGRMLLSGRPFISWYPFPGATDYTVQVTGEGVEWQKVVKGTALTYPSEYPAMQFGHTYKITILANQDGSAVSQGLKVVNLLSEDEAKYVAQMAVHLNKLHVAKDQVAVLDLDSLYKSRYLIDKTIEILKARIEADTRNPEVHRVLGDRYLEIGLPEYAKAQYEIATALAKKVADSDELIKAQQGLRAAQVALLHKEEEPLPARSN